jgi:hypothetical protein
MAAENASQGIFATEDVAARRKQGRERHVVWGPAALGDLTTSRAQLCEAAAGAGGVTQQSDEVDERPARADRRKLTRVATQDQPLDTV